MNALNQNQFGFTVHNVYASYALFLSSSLRLVYANRGCSDLPEILDWQ